MPQQQFLFQQDTNLLWIHVQGPGGEVVNQAAEGYYQQHYDQQEWLALPRSPYSYGEADSGVGYHYNPHHALPSDIYYYTSATYSTPPFQAYNQPQVVPFLAPPPSSPISIPNSSGAATTELSPFSSVSTSTSTSSSTGLASPDVCRQAQPNFNEQTQRWSCGGCNKTFSDKYGTERHIATVGLKVTCRYCGSRVSALGSSRRRHLGRDSCRKKAIQLGFTTYNEEDAFEE